MVISILERLGLAVSLTLFRRYNDSNYVSENESSSYFIVSDFSEGCEAGVGGRDG